MNLLEQSDRGHLLRCNLMRLLVSDLDANRQLAITMMETGGVPIVALRELRKILVGNDERYPALTSPKMSDRLSGLLDAGFAALPQDLTVYLSAWHNPNGEQGTRKRPRMAWEQPETFERTVAAGLMTWEQWADHWHIDGSLLRLTCLTGLLLEKGLHLERNCFLLGEGEGHALRKPWLRLLFARYSDPEFQLNCLRQLVQDEVLNLCSTALTELPKVADALENINAVDLGGTRISRLPARLLAQVHQVRGRNWQVKAISNQAVQEGPPGCILRLAEHMRWGLQHAADGQFEKALVCLEHDHQLWATKLFDYRQRMEFLQCKFDCAIAIGRWEEAVNVLTRMANHPSKENPVLRWKGWDVWKGLILAAGKEELFFAALEALPLPSNLSPAQFFCFHYPFGWAHYFERLLYRHGLDDALRLLDRAKASMPGLRLTMFRWDRILAHFKHLQQYSLTLQLYQYLDGPGAWLIKDPESEWLNDPRCIPDGHFALRMLGEEDLRKTYLDLTIRRKGPPERN